MTETIQIGKTTVYSKPLGLGSNAVGGHNLFPNLDDDMGKEIVRTALTHGIDLIDTAFAYGMGRSEELIGEVLKEFDRNKVVIATKAAHDPAKDGAFNNTPEFLTHSVEDALKRLQTDYIDIFYIHFPDKTTPKNEAIAALQKLKEVGKIHAIGVSNFTLEQIKEANQEGFIDIVEDEYSLIHREAENELFPYLKENQISFVPYFPLASGLLTGKYNRNVTFPPEDLRSKKTDFQGERFKSIIDKVSQLKLIAADYNVSVAAIVLAWYIKNPFVDVVIPGAKEPKQVINNVHALDVHLTEADYQHIDTLFKA
ncbi:aldo/keto reductase [Enterococcus caccae]|uniref:Oxidoreductase, aldo/keto reductase n=1 Tax=Enterococcus caccae ATCC BAA-1240 TaxID=1158612 RepID=R3TYC9_9ENTE|nr:aldo/keto reductase [Enterococcus caccae]EOL46604.1 oxidoreductase, aldo/keto reductase [Enterococcus caccae ATCC BAA-1240]EOT60678.1 oxidoreductase, aldo/keto reductase [Enterococcus caccae ATCC BAA-1240]